MLCAMRAHEMCNVVKSTPRFAASNASRDIHSKAHFCGSNTSFGNFFLSFASVRYGIVLNTCTTFWS